MTFMNPSLFLGCLFLDLDYHKEMIIGMAVIGKHQALSLMPHGIHNPTLLNFPTGHNMILDLLHHNIGLVQLTLHLRAFLAGGRLGPVVGEDVEAGVRVQVVVGVDAQDDLQVRVGFADLGEQGE